MLILVIAAAWFAIVAFAVVLCRGAARADAIALDQQRQASERVRIVAAREPAAPQRRPRASTARRLSSAARRRESRCVVGS
ncbi:MAG TPA: hypothetical protein VL979_10115 [Solirubrobacteraceae bacterium]|nr:hypothetical protein [Solirubrobacteraceae bacterium]